MQHDWFFLYFNVGRGGGVCVYIKNYHYVKLRDDLMSDEIDAVWVEIIIEKVNYLICIVYPPPIRTYWVLWKDIRHVR